MKFASNKTIKAIIISIAVLMIIGIIVLVASIIRSKDSSVKQSTSYSSKEMEEQITTNEITPISGPNKEEEPSIEDIPEEDLEEANLDNKKEIINIQSSNRSTPSTVKSNGRPYYVKVNYGANVVTVYTTDENNNYTVPVKAMVCSTGTATPRSGKYQSGYKARWIKLFGNVHGQYSTRIVGNILFHSVPYLQYSDPASLEYWEYDKLGTTASAGCVRLAVADAKWIYDNIGSGTIVEFYSDSNPGPLGKPSARKISGNESCRNWDPTDPDNNNPWRNVVETTHAPVPTVVPEQTPEPTPEQTPEPVTTPEPTQTPEPEATSETEPATEPTPEPTPEIETIITVPEPTYDE